MLSGPQTNRIRMGCVSGFLGLMAATNGGKTRQIIHKDFQCYVRSLRLDMVHHTSPSHGVSIVHCRHWKNPAFMTGCLYGNGFGEKSSDNGHQSFWGRAVNRTWSKRFSS